MRRRHDEDVNDNRRGVQMTRTTAPHLHHCKPLLAGGIMGA